jgi:hypothetical protein
MVRRTALLRALPILIFTLLFGAFIVALALRTAGGVRRSEDIVATYAPVAIACDGEAVATAPAYDAGASASHPVVVLRRTATGWAPDPAVLPPDWMPATPEEAELVLCLEAALPLTAPACDGGEQEAPTYGYATTARLVASATGEDVASTILNSAPDPGCWRPDTEAVLLSDEQIQGWLRQFAQPGPEP